MARLLCAALLLCSIAFVAYADEIQAALAEDSPVAAYAFDRASFLAASDSDTEYGYINRHKKHKHGKHKSYEDKYDKYEAKYKHGKDTDKDEDDKYDDKKDDKSGKYDDDKDDKSGKKDDDKKTDDKKADDKSGKNDDSKDSKKDSDSKDSKKDSSKDSGKDSSKDSSKDSKHSEGDKDSSKYYRDSKHGKHHKHNKHSKYDKYDKKDDKSGKYDDDKDDKSGKKDGKKTDDKKADDKSGKYDEDDDKPSHYYKRDEPSSGPGEHYYSRERYYREGPGYAYEKDSYSGGEYEAYEESDAKLCLQEVSRDPAGTFPDPSATSAIEFKSNFACCGGYYDAPASSVLTCNFTATSNAVSRVMGGSAPLEAQKGTVSASCEFTASGPCVPPKMLNKVFVTSSNANHTYWLVIDAALANETYPFGVYTAGNKGKASIQAAQPQAAQPAYSADGEYEYEPAYHTIETALGEVTQFTAYIASSAGLLKGGSLDFTAGFVDEEGNVLCPADSTTPTIAKPTVGRGAVPLVKCGQMRLKLWWAHSDGPYTGYDGKYQVPRDYYRYGGPEYSGPGPEYYGPRYSGPGPEYSGPGHYYHGGYDRHYSGEYDRYRDSYKGYKGRYHRY